MTSINATVRLSAALKHYVELSVVYPKAWYRGAAELLTIVCYKLLERPSFAGTTVSILDRAQAI